MLKYESFNIVLIPTGKPQGLKLGACVLTKKQMPAYKCCSSHKDLVGNSVGPYGMNTSCWVLPNEEPYIFLANLS